MRAASVALPISLTILVTLAGCRKAEPPSAEVQRTPPIHAATVSVSEQPMPESLTLTGSLRASQESEVAFGATGKVLSTFVERGQAVKQGETLAILDARGPTLTAAQAAAETGLARAQVEQAQRECERVRSLFKTGAISQAELDRTTAQCQASSFSAAAAEAQQQNAQQVVGDTIFRAPFAGIVGERYVNVGQFVQPGQRIVSLYAPDPLRLELTVPEANVAAMKVDAPVRFTVASVPDQTFACALKFISPNVRPSTRDLVVEALCPNPEGKLRPGMFAVASLQVGEKKLPVVPVAAVRRDEATARVFVVVDKRVQERIVQLGGEKDGSVAVVVGVKAGDTVVAQPGPDVRDGAQVQ